MIAEQKSILFILNLIQFKSETRPILFLDVLITVISLSQFSSSYCILLFSAQSSRIVPIFKTKNDNFVWKNIVV
jgi:hypothetical protein